MLIDEILINATNFNYKNIWNALHEAPSKKEVNYQFLCKIRKTLEPPQVKPLSVNDIDAYIEHPPKPSINNYEKRLLHNYNNIKLELRKEWELEAQEKHFQAAYSEWKKASLLVDKINLLVKERYEGYLKVKESFENEFQKFNIYRKKQTDELRRKYSHRDLEAIIEYHTLILKLINYPETFPQDFIVEYCDNNQIMVIDFSLPALEHIPTLKEVKEVRGVIKEYHLSEKQIIEKYDKILYSITLRTIYVILKSDSIYGAPKSLDNFQGNLRENSTVH